MNKNEIISEENIDETAARNYLEASYNGIDLLPCLPEILTESLAADVLKISEPTIKRMLHDKQIDLRKSTILNYIQQKMIVFRPLKLTENPPK